MGDNQPASDALRQFLDAIQERGDLQPDQSENVARATLRALGESIEAERVRELAEWLPPELRSELTEHQGLAKAFDRTQFLELIADGMPGWDATQVEAPAQAVLRTVRTAAPDTQVNATLNQLPPTLRELFT